MEGFNWIEPKRSAGRSGHVKANAWGRISFTNKSKGLPYISVVLYEQSLKALRWLIGDRVLIGYDEKAKMIAVKRVSSGGFAITKNGGSAKTSHKSARIAVVKPKNIDVRFEQIVFDNDSAQIVDGMLLIGLPS